MVTTRRIVSTGQGMLNSIFVTVINIQGMRPFLNTQGNKKDMTGSCHHGGEKTYLNRNNDSNISCGFVDMRVCVCVCVFILSNIFHLFLTEILEVDHARIIIAISSMGLLKLRGQYSYLTEVVPVEDRLRSFVCLLLQSVKLKVL